MVSRWADDALAQLEPELFYTDPGSEPVTRAGEIRRHDRERVRMQIQAALDQLEGDSWFGELVTEPRDTALPHSTAPEQAGAGLDSNISHATVPGEARLAWQEEDNALRLFANGESMVLSRDLLPAVIDLCDTWQLNTQQLSELLSGSEGHALLTFLFDRGALDVE
jgi:ribosomal protein L16 Arg81 hydroxylase